MNQCRYERWIGSVLLFFVFLFLITAGTAFAQSSTNYQVKKSVIDQGGATASQSTNHKLADAVGQPSAVSMAISTNYQIASGFFAGGKLLQLPDHWDFATGTGNSAIVVLPTSANPNIEGTPLVSGDYVGVFTPAGLCCGWSQWQAENMAITVWGDDYQTPDVDGFQAGEQINYRVYRASVQTEWTSVMVDYSQGNGFYSVDGYMILSKFDVFEGRTITLDFDQGWNMFSINVNPADPDVETIMTPIVDKVVIVKNGSGETYIPEYGINNIGDIDFKEGYQAYLLQAAALDVTGQVVDPATPISLPAGWSMISYLPVVPIDAATALASITDQLVIAKNNAGQAYIPQYGINNIGNMQPGQGYQVYLNAAGTLVYPSGVTPKPVVMSTFAKADQNHLKKTLTQHFQFTNNTDGNATVVVPSDIEPRYSDSALLENGDEIGVFTTNGLCSGAVVWEGINTAITVWGDNSQTDSLDGFQAGDALCFRVWKQSADIEYPANISYQEDHPYVYQTNGFSVLTELVADLTADVAGIGEPVIPSDFELIQNYPNPFNPETTIEYHLPETAEIILVIYDLQGHEVRRLVRGIKSAGYHTVYWDGRNAAGLLAASGMYFCRIEMNAKDAGHRSYVDIKKMILMK